MVPHRFREDDMTDVVQRQWGYSQVRAPMAKDAVEPGAPATAAAPERPAVRRRRHPLWPRRPTSRPPRPRSWPRPPVAAPPVVAPTVAKTPVVAPSRRKARGEHARRKASRRPTGGPGPDGLPGRSRTALRSPTDPGRADRPRRRPSADCTCPDPPGTSHAATADHSAGASGPRPSTRAAATGVAEAPLDPSLARLARGVQDCARALASITERLDSFERRLDRAGPPIPAPQPSAPQPAAPHVPVETHWRASESLHAMVRSLEGMSADRLQKLDQRLCKLESRAVPAGPINVEPVRAVERFATHRTPSTAGGGSAELAPTSTSSTLWPSWCRRTTPPPPTASSGSAASSGRSSTPSPPRAPARRRVTPPLTGQRRPGRRRCDLLRLWCGRGTSCPGRCVLEAVPEPELLGSIKSPSTWPTRTLRPSVSGVGSSRSSAR